MHKPVSVFIIKIFKGIFGLDRVKRIKFMKPEPTQTCAPFFFFFVKSIATNLTNLPH